MPYITPDAPVIPMMSITLRPPSWNSLLSHFDSFENDRMGLFQIFSGGLSLLPQWLDALKQQFFCNLEYTTPSLRTLANPVAWPHQLSTRFYRYPTYKTLSSSQLNVEFIYGPESVYFEICLS
jgi:hypothetical protein